MAFLSVYDLHCRIGLLIGLLQVGKEFSDIFQRLFLKYLKFNLMIFAMLELNLQLMINTSFY